MAKEKIEDWRRKITIIREANARAAREAELDRPCDQVRIGERIESRSQNARRAAHMNIDPYFRFLLNADDES